LLSGCSLFGVATKGEVNEISQKQASQQESIRRDVSAMRGQIDEISADLDALEPRMTMAESNVEAIAAMANDLNRSMSRMSMQIAQANEQLASMQGGWTAVLAEVDSFENGLGTVSDRADVAHANSLRAIEAYFKDLQHERQRLSTQLERLDQQLAVWEETHTEVPLGPSPVDVEDTSTPNEASMP